MTLAKHPPAIVMMAGGLAAVLLAALWLLGVFSRSLTGGPLAQADAFAARVPLASGEVLTWGTVLPPNQSTGEIVIESIQMVGVAGLEVLGIYVNVPELDGAVGAEYGFEPAKWNARSPAGATLSAPGSGQDHHIQVLVGVRRTSSAEGSIDAIRIRYRQDSQTYEDILPFSLTVFVSQG